LIRGDASYRFGTCPTASQCCGDARIPGSRLPGPVLLPVYVSTLSFLPVFRFISETIAGQLGPCRPLYLRPACFFRPFPFPASHELPVPNARIGKDFGGESRRPVGSFLVWPLGISLASFFPEKVHFSPLVPNAQEFHSIITFNLARTL